MLGADNSVVDATPKAIEILCLLIESDGRVVSKEEIISRVWAESFVEEANLSHHIFRLRRALGESESEKFIETVSKRGYRFVADIRKHPDTVKTVNETTNSYAEAATRSGFLSRKVIYAGAGLVIVAVVTVFLASYAQQPHNGGVNAPQQKSESMTTVQVTNSGVHAVSSISPDGKFVAYGDAFECMLYLRQVDTNTEVRLSKPGNCGYFGNTSFSRDGAYLYYILFDQRDTVGNLHRVPILGGNPTKILDNVNHYFTLSFDGKSAAYYRSNAETKQTSIIIGALDGSGKEQTVLTVDDDIEFAGVPAMSPDGKRLAVGLYDRATPENADGDRVGIGSVEIASGKITEPSPERWLSIGMMNWMPDSSGVALVGRRGKTRNQLFFVSYPTGVATAITREVGAYGNYGMGISADGKSMVADIMNFSSQLWSVDADGKARDASQITSSNYDGAHGLTTLPGGHVIYTSQTGSDRDLWKLVDNNGKREGSPFIDDEFSVSEPVASSDGSFLVFSSDRNGGSHLFRIDSNGENLMQLTFGDGVEESCDISPDGNWIVYSSLMDGKRRIWKTPSLPNTGSAVQLTDYDSTAPSFSPDGKMISLIVPSETIAGTGYLDIISANSAKLHSFKVIPFNWYYATPRWTPDGKSIVYCRTDAVAGNLWKQNLAGGESTQFTNFTTQKLYHFAYAHDRKSLIISRGNLTGDVVMLKNFRP